MKCLTTFAFAILLGLTARAGSSAGTDFKSPPPVTIPVSDWRGLYLGISIGGQFGRSENVDLDNYNFPDLQWDYSESGFVISEQVGYNWQWRQFVVGVEGDVGYMNLDGRGIEPGFPQDTYGESGSDFYATLRARLGVDLHGWLIYATAGAIGVNYETRVIDRQFTVRGPDTINASGEDFDFGYTVGAGVERMFGLFGRRWSAKVEYLYFDLGTQEFSARSGNGYGPYGWRGETDGHIVRVGLNYHF